MVKVLLLEPAYSSTKLIATPHMHATSTLLKAIATSLCWLLLTTQAFAGKPLVEGDDAPDWILNTPTQESLSLYRDSADSKAVILFWATWCPYCEALMPELQALKNELDGQSIDFYALNIWEDADPIAYMQRKGYTFKLLLDADKIAKRYHVRGTPGLFVVDENKKVIYARKKGTSPQESIEFVRTALSK
ncbi:hypothetical protein NBRC116494_06100 [Aurantivibrio plasticivorans]